MKYWGLLAMVLFFGCEQPEKKVIVKTPTHYDTVLAERAIGKAQQQKEDLADSLRQDSVIKVVIDYANKHIFESYNGLELAGLKSAGISCTLTFGHLFSEDKKHLIVKDRINDYQFNWSIFVLEKSGFKVVVKDVINDLTYVDRFIKDVNGDGSKDFLLNWYPESGCCARSVFNVYIYLPSTGSFTQKYEFMNPSFAPKEKLIRGVGYGHPGAVAMYKYKWNGLQIDTVEYIYPADTLKKKFYKVLNYKDIHNPATRVTLTSVPKEYKKIGGYEWFMMY